MAKDNAVRTAPGMSGYTAPQRKGVRYLEGKKKSDLIARARKARDKAKAERLVHS
jgi:hypothetical protein